MAVSSVFCAGLAAMTLTPVTRPDVVGGAPVFEIEMFRDAGMGVQASRAVTSPPASAQETQSASDIREPHGPTAPPQVSAPQSQPKGANIQAGAYRAFEPQEVVPVEVGPMRLPSVTHEASEGDDRKGAPDPGARGAADDDLYEAEVMRWIDRHKSHPGRLRGLVTLSFEVDRRGRILDCAIVRTSGDHRLDRIAQQQLKAAAPLPRPPHNTTWQSRKLVVSLDYRPHV